MLTFRPAQLSDADLYYAWANEDQVRQNSFNSAKISYEEHVAWFTKKLDDPHCSFYLFVNESQEPVGQVRIESKSSETVIGISVDPKQRGHSYAQEMLRSSCSDYLKKNPEKVITAYIKKGNEASLRSFEKAGFINREDVLVDKIPSYKLFFHL